MYVCVSVYVYVCMGACGCVSTASVLLCIGVRALVQLGKVTLDTAFGEGLFVRITDVHVCV